jgi:DNA adenine methylase
MILRRLGNKKKICDNIINHFPSHKVYYEPFFGTGAVYFHKPKSQYSILNDLDNDVFNLFMVVKDNKEELINLLSQTPMHEDLFYYWVSHIESNHINKALRFLFISSFSYLGKSDMFMLLHSNCSYKKKLELLISECSKCFNNCMWRNKDFRLFFKDIYVTDKHIGIKDRFIYADPPYVDTTDNYSTPKWTKKDFIDLLDTLIGTGIRFAVSEFYGEFVIEESKKRCLNVIEIGERRNLKNNRVEILITNYDSNSQMSLFM